MRGYLGSRASLKVFGRWNDTDVRVFLEVWEWTPWSAAFFAALALLSFGADFDLEADALAFVGFVVAIAGDKLLSLVT